MRCPTVLIGFAGLAALACQPLSAQTPNAQMQAPDRAAAAFLEAYTALDQDRFDSFFAPDVTVFFPDGAFPPERVEGKQKVLAAFHGIFAAFKARGVKRAPISPLDMQVTDHGTFAIVTFHLKAKGDVGRRSLVLRRDPPGWRIVHLHASAIHDD